MKKQAYNPYLPSYEYIPDGEPYIFGDRLYVFGSHDRFNGDVFCQNDYVCWSAPVDNLADWRYEGCLYDRSKDPMNTDNTQYTYAPDIQQGPDGRFYLYYSLDMTSVMSVAVCDDLTGEYEYYGAVRYPDGRIVGENQEDVYQFDPGVFIDDDGRIYLYTGFSPFFGEMGFEESERSLFDGRLTDGGYLMELEDDMLTLKSAPKRIVPGLILADGTDFERHAFFEASSMRKINGHYYLIYSSANSHELCYAIGERPDGPFGYGGTIISNGDVFLNGRSLEQAVGYMGNNHGSLVQVKKRWYIFYHRHTNRHSFSRQACAEAIQIKQDGSIPQVEMTSCGLNGKPLDGRGTYPAYIACNLYSKNGACFTDAAAPSHTQPEAAEHPYFTQTGEDREQNGDQYIANIRNGAIAGFKYFNLQDTYYITVEISGTARGFLAVRSGAKGATVARIPIEVEGEMRTFTTELSPQTSKTALFFTFEGKGAIDFHSFTLM